MEFNYTNVFESIANKSTELSTLAIQKLSESGLNVSSTIAKLLSILILLLLLFLTLKITQKVVKVVLIILIVLIIISLGYSLVA
jgi:hypothetical protein